MALDMIAIVNDEIALEGLEGINLTTLWLRLKNKEFPLDPYEDHVQAYLWKNAILKGCSRNDFNLFSLPHPRDQFQYYNRYDTINPENGICCEDPKTVPEDCYQPVTPIADGKIRGSCNLYKERIDITESVVNGAFSYDHIQNEYGNKLVVVASQTMREKALGLNLIDPVVDLSPMQYAMIERIGRAREIGDVTIGAEAMQCKEPSKKMFYHRKGLLEKKLIKKQLHILCNPKTGQNRRGLLLTLPRFNSERLTPMETSAQRISDQLDNEPERECDYFELRNKLDISNKMYRAIFPNYMKFFKVFEEAADSKGKSSKRIVKLVKSINRNNYNSDDSENEDEDDDDKEHGDLSMLGKFFDPSKIYSDRTMLTQVLHFIETWPLEGGVSLREIGEELKLPKLDVRTYTRSLERLHEVSTVMVDCGRQKMFKFIPRMKSEDAQKQLESERKSLNWSVSDTVLNLRRANVILDYVKQHKIVDHIYIFKKLISEMEKDYPFTIDIKSIKRLIQKLASEGKVRSISTILRQGDRVRKLTFVCDTNISVDSPIIKEKITLWKFKLFGVKEGLSKEIKIKRTNDGKKPVISSNENPIELKYTPSIGWKYGLEPKMKKLMTLYKFLFYLLYCKPEVKKFNDWRRYITPLETPVFTEHTFQLGDIIHRIPVSIFVKIVFITYEIPGLEDYLKDEEKINYTLIMLPSGLRNLLLYRRKYMFSIVEELTSLSYMGLTKLESQEQLPKESTLVNLFNKTKMQIDEELHECIFDSFEDVEKFSEQLLFHCSIRQCDNCFLDKRLFAHNPRNWTYAPKVKSSGNQITPRRISKTRKKENLKKKDPAIKESKQGKSKKRENSDTQPNKPSKKLKIDNQKSVKTSKKKKGKKREDVVKNAVKPHKKLRLSNYDNVDTQALSLLKMRRCEWTPEEDSFLLMCKVTSSLVDPNHTKSICVSRCILRDELHKHLPDVSMDKTSRACLRRVCYMMKNPKTRQNVIEWIAECKQDIDLMNLIEKPNLPKTHIEEWKQSFLKLLHILLTRLQATHLSTTSHLSNQIFLKSVEDLNNYKIRELEEHMLMNKSPLHQDPRNIVDICVSVVTNILFSTLMLNTHKENCDNSSNYSHMLFKIYQRYPDTLIRSVVAKLHKHGLMTKIKKHDASILKSRGVTPFKVSNHCLFVMKTRLDLETILPPLGLDGITYFENGRTNSDSIIAVAAITAHCVNVDITIPDNFIVLDESSPFMRTPKKSLDEIKNSSRLALYALRQQLTSKSSDRNQHLQDFLVLNACNVKFTTTRNQPLKKDEFENIIRFQRKIVESINEVEEENSLLNFIKCKKELGSTYDEILTFSKSVWPEDLIANWIERGIVYRVGVTLFRWVHHENIIPWLVHSIDSPNLKISKKRLSPLEKSIKFVPRFWKKPTGELDLRTLFKYMSCVLGHIIINPGIKKNELESQLDIILPPIEHMEIIELLVAAECIEILRFNAYTKPVLFGGNIPMEDFTYYEATPEDNGFTGDDEQRTNILKSETWLKCPVEEVFGMRDADAANLFVKRLNDQMK